VGYNVTDPLIDAEDEASTPLMPDARDALIPSYITQRGELNEIEQIGIADADRWAFARRRDILSEEFLCQLHRRMFGNVWRWAGAFSQEVNRRIGADCWQICPDLRQLLDDVRHWVEHQTYAADGASRLPDADVVFLPPKVHDRVRKPDYPQSVRKVIKVHRLIVQTGNTFYKFPKRPTFLIEARYI
jgi:hypothetical protein